MDHLKPAEAILKQARDKGAMIATAESCTGGLVAGALTHVAGSSDVFDRGFVTYSNAAKEQMLDVSADTLTKFGAVSEQVATEMATGALRASDADLAVSITGIAGPGGSDHKPEGRVCFALALRSGRVSQMTQEFGAIGREQVRQAAVAKALNLLLQGLSQL